MGKFKDFLLNEDIGLGNLGPNIDNMMNSHWFDSQIGGAFASSDVTGTEAAPQEGFSGSSLFLPSTDLTIPSVEKTGRITTLLLKRNPIYIRLSDGTEANFTYDEYRRIEGEPELGKNMTLIFQRSPEDQGQGYSKIDKAIVR